MVFASQVFLFVFLPIVLLLYYLAPGRSRSGLLLLASYVCYVWGAPKFLPILILSTYFDYHVALRISRTAVPRSRRNLLIASAVVNLGLLAYFKYAGFVVASASSLVGGLWAEPGWVLSVSLPIGISFFTFHKLSYVIDVYRGTARPQKRLAPFALYIALFPQLIAGPIIRYHQIVDQLVERRHSVAKFYDGVIRFCFGLGKKVLIANVLGHAADSMLAPSAGPLTWAASWVAMLCYTFQIYFDFSGYSDMAIGMGSMFGFTFPENFNQPYISRSITEFWRRWHMSLSGWFRDYLYIPLGGNRISPARTYLNLWIVFLLCGIWHGASWTFVAWGCYHGILLVIEHSFLLKRLQRLPALLSIPFTFVLVIVGWVFFRMPTFDQALALLHRMFLPMPASALARPLGDLVDARVIATLIIAGVLSFHAEFLAALPPVRAAAERLRGNAWACGAAGIALFVVAWTALAAGTFNPFIYYRF